MRGRHQWITLAGMARRLLVLVLAAAIVALGAAPAGATIFAHTTWDVSIEGKQTVRWSFAAERPDTCSSYLGTPSEEAVGSGSISMSFATKRKKPLWAETYLSGHKLQFSSFSTDGWSIPAVFTKKGKFSVTPGMPCDSDPGDPPPLSRISKDSGCGSQKTTMQPSLTWERGDFQMLGGVEPVYHSEDCPGPFEPEMYVGAWDTCLPKKQIAGLEGTPLQGFSVAVDSDEFLKGKTFDVSANEKYQCEFPSHWYDEPPLKLLLQTRYDVTFKPTKHF